MKIPARHQNRDFRTRSGTPAPDQTLASITSLEAPIGAPRTRGGRFRRIGGQRHPWNVWEELLLTAAGVALLAAVAIPSPLIALATLPAVLLAPGHLILRWLGRGFDGNGDPWLSWVLRVILSLSFWTVSGAIMVLAPGLDPRWLGYAVGAGLLLLAAVRVGTRSPTGSRDRTSRPVSARSAGPDDSDLPIGPRTAWAREGVQPGQVAVLACFAVIAAAAIGGAYVISSSGPARPQPFIALNFTDPTIPVYDEAGISATVEVRNSSTSEVTARLDAYVDGRNRLSRPITVAPGGTATVELRGIRTPECWRTMRVELVGGPASLQPRPLVGYGPQTLPGSCTPSTTP